MKVKNFQELLVWQKGHKLALQIYQLTKAFPREEKFGLTNQVRRSSVSVCANIAEGFKKGTKEFARYLEISEGSLEETKYYLILSRDLKYLTEEEFNPMSNLADEIGKMLCSLMERLKERLAF